jgi:hypothetical protein
MQKMHSLSTEVDEDIGKARVFMTLESAVPFDGHRLVVRE